MLGAKVADLATVFNVQKIIEKQIKKWHISLITMTTITIDC
jgi:hypothetical protein